MIKNKVKVSNILNNQFPQFVRENYPLVVEFFEQYYKSQEIPGGSLDLLNNIDQYIKLDNNSNIIEETTLYKSDDSEYFVDIFDDTIYVKSVNGFADRNGLIQIDDEIITYEYIDKENNAFIGCVRGFSGIEGFSDNKELIFLSTLSDQHQKNSIVKNLNILFLKEFLNKIKVQFSPGLHNRNFYENSDEFLKLNKNIFIKHSSDFYSSKGTEKSFRILFKSLFNDEVSIINPKDFLIEPSSAEYRVTKNLVVESISGNPLELRNRTLFQTDLQGSLEAYGSVTKVEKITRDNKDYYIVSLDYDYDKDISVDGSIFGSFSIHTKTLCTDFIAANSSTITVDSTVGFLDSGEIVVDFDDGEQILITYESKSLNQFYNCSFISRDIPLGTEIKTNFNAFSYSNPERTEKIIVRITGVLESLDIEDENNQLYNVGDTARITTYGIEDDSPLFSNWVYNVPTSYIIDEDDLVFQGFSNGYRYEIFTKDRNNIYDNDQVELDYIFLDSNGVSVRTKKVFDSKPGSVPKKSIQITSDNEITRVFRIKKLIVKTIGYDFTANIQNTYKDPSDGSLYVAAPSLPNYFGENLSIKDRSITLNGYFSEPDNYDPNEDNSGDSSGELIIFKNKNGNLKKHSFISGDAIVYIPGDDQNRLTISDVGTNLQTVYYVKKIDDNSIKIALSSENVDNNTFLKISGTLTDDANKFVLFRFCDENLNPKNIGTQKLIRNLKTPIKSNKKNETLSGAIGIFGNGVELLNYKSQDVIYSGKIEDIEVLYGGDNYDVINPPILEIDNPANQIESKVLANVSVEGYLDRIEVLDSGFGYSKEPKIIITGGGGVNAKAKANLKAYDHSISFNASSTGNIDLDNNTIKLQKNHNFYTGEKIIYDSNNELNAGAIKTGQYYYISVVNSKEFRLHQTYDNAINNINPVILNYSNGIHSIKALIKKNKIESIIVTDRGSGYKNNKKIAYPENVKLEIDTINIKRHNFNSGDIIKYYSDNPIGGLENDKTYYVTKIDSDNIKLSEVYTDINNKDFLYQTKQYIKFLSIGESDHIFNYPPIDVKIIGDIDIQTSFDQDFNAVIRPIFRGSITDISILSSGFGYGSNNIINYNKQPNYKFISGANARLKPLIVDGKIVEILVENSGSNYNSIPNIKIDGIGIGAVLTPNIVNGSISSVSVINGGFGYDGSTKITIVNPGTGCKLNFKIQKWTVNLVNRLILSNQISNDDGFLTDPLYVKNDLQYSHVYTPKKLRGYVYSTKTEDNIVKYRKDIDNDLETNSFYHSPILGWSYDGCPIYGPYGYEYPSGENGGKIVQMKSGYNGYDDDVISLKSNRPDVNEFPLGFFVEDYDFIGNGDLDECNGRFCKTPEFPNGVYAYFTTVSPEISTDTNGFINFKKPIFPYVIGNYFKFDPIRFNFDSKSNQDTIKIDKTNWDRNTVFYNINSQYSDYDFIFKPDKIKSNFTNVTSLKTGKIDNIRVSISGTDYSIGDPLIFDEKNNGILYADVSEIYGKEVEKIKTDSISIATVEFISLKNNNEVLAISPIPHNLNNGDKIFVNNLNKFSSISGPYSITNIQNSLILLESVGNASTTGIVTTFKVFGNLIFPKIKENDIYSIGDEKIKVLNIDEKNYTIKVQREYDSTISSSHSESTVLIENPRKLFFNIDKTFDYAGSIDDEYYFDPQYSLNIINPSSIIDELPLFLSINEYKDEVGIQTGTETILYFTNISNLSKYNSGYVDIVNSTNPLLDATKKKIISIGSTSITLDYDTSSYNGIGVTAQINKWSSINTPSYSIYLPNNNINTGDRLLYKTNSGIGMTVFNKDFSYELQNNDVLYAAKISDDIIGISSNRIGLGTNGSFVGIGTTTDLLYFVNYGVGNNHSFKTIKENVLTANIITNKCTIYTKAEHELVPNDIVDITCLPEEDTNIKVQYDPTLKRLIVDPKIISNESVNISENTITIENHRYYTGQKVVYKSNDIVIGGLSEGQIYYVYVLDFNTIKLCSSYYDSTLPQPNYIELISSGNGLLYKINPEFNITKNNTIIFDLADSSLSYFDGINQKSAFDFKLFEDSDCLYEYLGDVSSKNKFVVRKYGQIGITTDARVEVFTKDIDVNNLFYKLYPTINSDVVIYDDIEVVNNNKINLNNSSYNGKYNIVEVDTNKSFIITLNETPENLEYTENINYSTFSRASKGGIKSVSIKLNGSNLKELPVIEGISSKTGSGAVLYPESSDIGKINSYKISDIGFNYSSDTSINPKAKFPSIVKIEPLSSIDKIEVKNIGLNYTSPPQLTAIDSYTNEVIEDLVLDYSIKDRKVYVIQNTKGIYNVEPKIIPTNNTNGISIKSVSYDPTSKTVTAILSAYYDSFESYPFRIGDKILVEGIRNLNDGIGYNSVDNNFAFFTVSGLANIFGSVNSIVEYTFEYGDPGTFDPECTSGSIIPENYLPTFSTTLKKNIFLVGETVTTDDGDIGIVEEWYSDNELLKIDTSDNFNVNTFITGKTSGSVGKISKSTHCKSKYNISSTSIVNNGWNTQKGYLNSTFQRIHDSDYYQNFSYSVKSNISLNEWNDAVSSLNHISGFKKFSDLNVQSIQSNAGISTDQDVGVSENILDVEGSADINCISDFDLVSENNYLIDSKLSSDQIFFNSKQLQDYTESRGNRVLVIDDISSLFDSLGGLDKYIAVDSFLKSQTNTKKYIFLVRDKLFDTDLQLNVVTVLQDSGGAFVNQYGTLFSSKNLGSFDVEGSVFSTELRFYPINYEFNDYNISFINYGFNKNIEDNDVVLFGDISKIYGDQSNIVGFGTTTLLQFDPQEIRAIKILNEIEDSEKNIIQYNELVLLYDGNEINSLEYGNLSNSYVGLGTFNAYKSNTDIKLDFIPSVNGSGQLVSRSYVTTISNSSYSGIGSVPLITSLVNSQTASIGSTSSPVLNNISEYSDDNSAAYYIISIEDTTNQRYQVSEILLINDSDQCYFTQYGNLYTDGSLGIFNASREEDSIVLQFEPIPDIDVEIRLLETTLRLPDRFTTNPSIIV